MRVCVCLRACVSNCVCVCWCVCFGECMWLHELVRLFWRLCLRVYVCVFV